MAHLCDFNPWTRAIWAHLIQTGEALSLHQITRRWGDPPSYVLTPEQMLDAAAGQGFFRKLKGRPVRYYAARPQRSQRVEKESYFEPAARPVRSVWEIAS